MHKDNQFTVIGIIIWLICAVFFLYEFLLRTVIGTFQSPIMYDFNIDSFKYSILSTSAYLGIYGLMQIPVGLIIDSIGLKKSILLGCGICAISAIGFSLTYTYYTAVPLRMLMGLGSSFGFVCLIVAVYDWFPRKYTALFIGLSQFIGTMGPMLAAGPLNSMAENATTSWREVFFHLGIWGLIFLLPIFLIVRNNNLKTSNYIVIRKREKANILLRNIFFNKTPWIIAIYSACVYFAIEYLSENEAKNYITLKGFSSSFASYMITVSWIGYAIGCPLLGFLSDYFKRRKTLMVVASFFLVIALTAIYLSTSETCIVIAFFLLGIGASGQSIGFAFIAEHFKKRYLAIAISLNNAMIMALSSVNAPLIGLALDHFKQDLDIQLSDYSIVFGILIAVAIISLLISMLGIKENFCKSKVEMTFLSTEKN
ncbi:MAG: MFS transporter [Francisellaceae bacterium]|jgi:MFS family permease|nr:MFS transporter [Francisellaceae bacterium]